MKYHRIRLCARCHTYRLLKHVLSVKLYIYLLHKEISSYYEQRYNHLIITYWSSQCSTFIIWYRSVLVASLPLDLADLDNIATCSDKLKSFLGPKKINVLMNNAGIMALPTREVSMPLIQFFTVFHTLVCWHKYPLLICSLWFRLESLVFILFFLLFLVYFINIFCFFLFFCYRTCLFLIFFLFHILEN